MSIYKTESGKKHSLELYEKQLRKLELPFTDIFMDTSFGKTHVIDTGNQKGKPLLVFHGGNSTSSYNLLICRFLLQYFHIYAVDTIGHPGKSAEVCLSHRGYEYGKWASEVIDELGYDKIACFGGSFGGGILAKLMCVAPEKVERAVLVVPAGIKNAIPISSMKMMIPLLQYRMTKKEKYLKKTALYMAIQESVLDEDTLDIVKDSFDNVKTKVGMPSNIHTRYIKEYKAPALVMAAEKDCLFPAKKVLPRAKQIFSDCRTYLLKGRGHMHCLTREEQDMVTDFLQSN